MSTVGQVQFSSPQTIPLQGQPASNRVTEATKPFLQRTKEFITRSWHATVMGFKAGADKISFVFFRVLEWIHPSLGPKVEVVFLRIANVWQSIKDAWKQEEIRKEIEGLKTENQTLHATVRQLSTVAEENDRLRLENSRLAPFEQLSHTHQQRAQSLVLQQNNITDREGAALRQRDILLIENTTLKREKEQLTTQRNSSAQLLVITLAQNQDFQANLARLQQEVLVLRSQIESNREMDQNLTTIANACARLPQRPLQQRAEIDDDLEKLLPLLLRQMQTARSNLTLAKQNLPLHSSAEIPLQSLDRILNELVKYLNRIPPALQLHAHWQQPIQQV